MQAGCGTGDCSVDRGGGAVCWKVWQGTETALCGLHRPNEIPGPVKRLCGGKKRLASTAALKNKAAYQCRYCVARLWRGGVLSTTRWRQRRRTETTMTTWLCRSKQHGLMNIADSFSLWVISQSSFLDCRSFSSVFFFGGPDISFLFLSTFFYDLKGVAIKWQCSSFHGAGSGLFPSITTAPTTTRQLYERRVLLRTPIHVNHHIGNRPQVEMGKLSFIYQRETYMRVRQCFCSHRRELLVTENAGTWVIVIEVGIFTLEPGSVFSR